LDDESPLLEITLTLDPPLAGRFSLHAMLRLLLILALTLSASLAGAFAPERVVITGHEHHAIHDIEADAPMCCEHGLERAHTCITMPALCEGSPANQGTITANGAEFELDERALIGVPPSALLDPPRTV
jgi:hypothetical protein